jgi:hypothetical protein
MTDFAAVGRLICDPRPQWLTTTLESFSDLIRELAQAAQTIKDTRRQHAKALEAAKTLAAYLPVFEWEATINGKQILPAVAACQTSLPGVIAELMRLGRPPVGRRYNYARELCATVVSECWRHCHGTARPRSDYVAEACNAYWRACGCAEIGKEGLIENWRRYLEAVRDHPNSFARERRIIQDSIGSKIVI